MHQSGLVIAIPQAESRFGAMRQRFDPQANLGVPAHITILFPFMPPGQIDGQVRRRLARAVARIAAFRCVLDRVDRFPSTAYLAPHDPAPFVDVTMAVVGEFPEYPPYGGAHAGIVPHLTVADGDAHAARIAEQELRAALENEGPVIARCVSVQLLENSSGYWRQMDEFSLAAPPDTPENFP